MRVFGIFQGRLVIWVSDLLEPAMAKWAPDLWHWRSHVFDLRKIQQKKRPVAQSHNNTSHRNSSDDTRTGAARRLPALQNQLDAYRKAGKRGDEARLLDAIAVERLELGQAQLAAQNVDAAWSALGESRRAIGFYEQALVIARELGYIRGEGNQLANMGSAWLDLGEPHRAIEFCKQALVISREIGISVAKVPTWVTRALPGLPWANSLAPLSITSMP